MRPSRMWALPHAVGDGLDAARDLRNHPALDGSVCYEPSELDGVRLPNQRGRIVDVAPQPFDVGEIYQLLGLERFSDRSSDGVGVDVVRLTVFVGSDGGNDWDELFVEETEQHPRVDCRDVTDEPQLRIAGGCANQPSVNSADTNGQIAVHVDRGHDLGVDLARQHHACDVDGLGICYSEPVDKLRRLAEPPHEIADLRPATVDDDRPQPDQAHQHDVFGEECQCVVLGCAGESVAAVLHHDRLASELADVWQSLHQHLGTFVRVHVVDGHVVVVMVMVRRRCW